jgi:predicted nucleic acid-binding protein
LRRQEKWGLSPITRSAGNPISFPDCAIAAIAAANGYMVATRNGRDFKGTGVTIVDPWV